MDIPNVTPELLLAPACDEAMKYASEPNILRARSPIYAKTYKNMAGKTRTARWHDLVRKQPTGLFFKPNRL